MAKLSFKRLLSVHISSPCTSFSSGINELRAHQCKMNISIIKVLFFISFCLTQLTRYQVFAATAPVDKSQCPLKINGNDDDYDYDDDDDNDDDDDDNDDDYNHKHQWYCISLPQNTPWHCKDSRQEMLRTNALRYRLSTPPKVEIDPTMPYDFRVLSFFLFPLLNLTSQDVLTLSENDPKEKLLSKLYVELVKRNQALIVQKTMQGKVFTKYCDYAELLEFYRKKQHTGTYKDRYFRFPSKEEAFKDIIKTGDWKNDQVFVEQRLAGINPMSLRKLTAEELKSNPKRFSPDLDRAIKRVLNNEETSFLQMIEEGLIFIADYPLIHNLTNVDDILDFNPNDEREMRYSKSPIAVFASVKNCFTGAHQLKAVAIQMDFDANSDIVLPTDGSKWQLAKQEVQRADITHLEIIEHLLKTHLMMEPVCVTIKRTLSVYHPLNQILQWHCRGTFITNSIGLPNLVNKCGYMHRLLAIGDVGSIELLNRGYISLTWDDTDFKENLKRRGVDDLKKLPYFPYRDDGTVIWNVIQEFAKDYVNMYYYYTRDIIHDKELQNFANELSADGAGSTGGVGMLKNFPARIERKDELVDILARIIFIPVQHHIVAYPVEYYGGFVPNMSTKLYDDPRVPDGEFGLYSLPESNVTLIQVALAMSLSALRYDKLFDYYSKLSQSRARRLVYQYYCHLMGDVRRRLRKRNKQRLQDGHLTYPYFLPNWIPNSIHA